MNNKYDYKYYLYRKWIQYVLNLAYKISLYHIILYFLLFFIKKSHSNTNLNKYLINHIAIN